MRSDAAKFLSEQGTGAMTKAQYDAYVEATGHPVNWSPRHGDRFHKGGKSRQNATEAGAQLLDGHTRSS
jgi:hypothetical protein